MTTIYLLPYEIIQLIGNNLTLPKTRLRFIVTSKYIFRIFQEHDSESMRLFSILQRYQKINTTLKSHIYKIFTHDVFRDDFMSLSIRNDRQHNNACIYRLYKYSLITYPRDPLITIFLDVFNINKKSEISIEYNSYHDTISDVDEWRNGGFIVRSLPTKIRDLLLTHNLI